VGDHAVRIASNPASHHTNLSFEPKYGGQVFDSKGEEADFGDARLDHEESCCYGRTKSRRNAAGDGGWSHENDMREKSCEDDLTA
jgi:hypothetical protein